VQRWPCSCPATSCTAGAPRSTDALMVALSELYADAYAEGVHEAATACGGDMPAWTAPAGGFAKGLGTNLLRLAGGALGTLLRALVQRIRGISETQLKRIAVAIGAAVEAGEPISEAIAAVDAIVNDAAKALEVTETEYVRAQTAAVMETYRANDVPAVAWLAQPDCCPECRVNAEASPIPLGDPWPRGTVPVHPNCRCALAPQIMVAGVLQPTF
jgi:hypothetical protein